MPTTRTRRAWIPLAVQCFLDQDYPHRELVVASEDSLDGLLIADSRVRYAQTPRGITLGEKRNLVHEQARGQLVAVWDDDDWYAPWRLSTQVRVLQTTGRRSSGCRRLLFLDTQTCEFWQYHWPISLPGACHQTLLYERSVWQEGGYPHVQVASDYHWCQARCLDVAGVDRLICVATAHAHNTSPRVFRSPYQRVLHPALPDECQGWIARAIELDRVHDQV